MIFALSQSGLSQHPSPLLPWYLSGTSRLWRGICALWQVALRITFQQAGWILPLIWHLSSLIIWPQVESHQCHLCSEALTLWCAKIVCLSTWRSHWRLQGCPPFTAATGLASCARRSSEEQLLLVQGRGWRLASLTLGLEWIFFGFKMVHLIWTDMDWYGLKGMALSLARAQEEQSLCVLKPWEKQALYHWLTADRI